MNMSHTLPEPPPPQPEQDDRSRTRLLQAAVHVFDRKGYISASVREIAEAAGVTKPAVYYHFGSKEGLLVAVLNEAVSQFGAVIDAGAARAGSARDRLLALCSDIYGLFEKNVPIVRVAHTVFLGPPGVAPAFDMAVFEQALSRTIQRIVEDGQAAGELRRAPVFDTTVAVMGVLNGCLERQLHPALRPVGIEGLQRALAVLFDGIVNERRAQGEQTR